MTLLHLLLFVFAGLVAARCECGYTVTSNADNDTQTWHFTDMLETDFTAMEEISDSVHWIPQEFNISAERARGEFGKNFDDDNVVIGEISKRQSSTDTGVALDLTVQSTVHADAILSAELDTDRRDLRYGSYRAGMKATPTGGTCAAFFWYYNDTQEIDMEFLSREFIPEENIYPLSLVIQSQESKEYGYDASGTSTYQKVNLTFDPTEDFHEYRFDFLPGRVYFYADSEHLITMEDDAVPSVGGHLILQHWSNGNPNWSGGPPERNAVASFSYVKAYFNSSSSDQMDNKRDECNAAKEDSEDEDEDDDDFICDVPDVTTADQARNGGNFFGPTDPDPEADEDAAPRIWGQGPPISLVTTIAGAVLLFMTFT